MSDQETKWTSMTIFLMLCRDFCKQPTRPIRKFYTPYVVLFLGHPRCYAISYVHGKIRLSDAK